MTDENQKQSQWWVDSIKTLGLPTVFCIALLYIIIAAARWASTDVVKPVMLRHMEFIDIATKTLQETQLASAAVQHGQSQGFADLDRIEETMKQMSVDMKHMIDMLKEIERSLAARGAQ